MRAAFFLIALTCAGCASVPDCATIGADAVAGLTCVARTGDKAAQLELGKRFEDGVGLERDTRRAAALYRQAATSTSGTTYVYSPPVGKEGRGRVLPVRLGPDAPGLPEAKYRLALLHLRGDGVRRDIERARRLLRQASDQDYAPAAARLREMN